MFRKLVDSMRTAAGLDRLAAPAAGDRREVAAEPAQVARARAAPAVDRLARVTDRGHRMAAAEQRPEQDQLGVAGVLVLVEQHDLVAAPLGGADLGVAGGDPGGDGHLVAVVDDLPRGLGPRRTRPPSAAAAPGRAGSPGSCDHGGQLPGQRPACASQPVPDRGHVVRCPQVLGQLARQHQHGRGDRGR